MPNRNLDGRKTRCWIRAVVIGAALAFAAPGGFAQNWEPVSGADDLTALFSETTLEATLKDGVIARARYNADGTGSLDAWNDTFDRKWEVRRDDQICILIDGEFDCFTLVRNRDDPAEYRATYVDTGERAVVFRIVEGLAVAPDMPVTQRGGAGQP